MKSSALAALATATTLLLGCQPFIGERETPSLAAPHQVKTTAQNLGEPDWGPRYRSAVLFGNAGRGGAAFRVPAYVHMATTNPARGDGLTVISETVAAVPEGKRAPIISTPIPAPSIEVTESRGLWQRYCDPDIVISPAEENEIARLGGWDAVPEPLKAQCLPPK